MTAAVEMLAAAAAIRRQQNIDATFHHAVADLLDRVAVYDPYSEDGDALLASVSSAARDVARAYQQPCGHRHIDWAAHDPAVTR